MKNKIKIILVSFLSVIAIVGTGLIFSSDLILPNFPYKFTAITTKIKNANVNNESIKNYLVVDKEKTLQELKEQADTSQQLSNNITNQMNNFSTPKGIDYGSMLIFIEQKGIENKLQVLDIKFDTLQNNSIFDTLNNTKNNEEVIKNKDQENQESQENNQESQENNQESQENKQLENNNNQSNQQNNQIQNNTNSYQAIGQYTPSIVKVKMIGPYANIQKFLETLPNDLGVFNYIDNLKIWKSKDSLAKQGINSNNNYLFQDEKNVIIEFDIVLYNK